MSDLESAYFYYTETGLICLVLFFHFKFVAQCNYHLVVIKTFYFLQSVSCKKCNHQEILFKSMKYNLIYCIIIYRVYSI